MRDLGTATTTRTSCLGGEVSLLPCQDLHLNRPEAKIIVQIIHSLI